MKRVTILVAALCMFGCVDKSKEADEADRAAAVADELERATQEVLEAPR
jgi:hypothetical protein